MVNKWRATGVSTLLVLSMVATACSSGGASTSSPEASATAKTAEATAQASASPEELYLGKYDPPIEISTVRILTSDLKFAEGESLDNNQWTKTLQEKLGIKVNNKWVVKSDQGEQKLNVTIASGDLPDFIPVNNVQLKQLVDAGQLEDLTEAYNKYASPMTKQFLGDATNALASATYNGKLMGIPNPGSTLDASPMVWIRNDWLKKLNLPEPKSMADILAISEAFTTKDPDGNGKNDTFGLAMMKNLYGDFASLNGFFNSYHAYPTQWVKDSSGNLAYGSIQPEMKTALATLQDMYKKGQIDKEFGVKDEAKEGELAAAGKLGITFGPMWISLGALMDNKKNDPNADWQAYALPSADGKAVNPQIPGIAVNPSVNSYYVAKKGVKNPEALIKMLNLFAELQFGPNTPQDVWQKHSKVNGIEVWPYYPFLVGQPNKNLSIHEKVVKALDSKDTKGFNPEEMDAYNHSVAIESGKGDVTNWGFDKVFGRKGSYGVIAEYVKNKVLKPSEFYGVMTPTMAEKTSTLKKMELEVFTKIIMGDSLEQFDKFVSDWKKLGGDQITQEVNNWSKSK